MVMGASEGATLSHRDIPVSIRQDPAIASRYIRVARGASMHTAERIMIEETLKACNHDKNACAKTLGIGLRTLYRKLNEYNASNE